MAAQLLAPQPCSWFICKCHHRTRLLMAPLPEHGRSGSGLRWGGCAGSWGPGAENSCYATVVTNIAIWLFLLPLVSSGMRRWFGWLAQLLPRQPLLGLTSWAALWFAEKLQDLKSQGTWLEQQSRKAFDESSKTQTRAHFKAYSMVVMVAEKESFINTLHLHSVGQQSCSEALSGSALRKEVDCLAAFVISLLKTFQILYHTNLDSTLKVIGTDGARCPVV